jgi:hypothetical protein
MPKFLTVVGFFSKIWVAYGQEAGSARGEAGSLVGWLGLAALSNQTPMG